MTVQEAIAAAELLLPGIAAPDGEIDPRWQAIIKVGDFIESDPEPIWQFTAKWGCHADADLRMGIACCLLEHLLEWHFETIFPRAASLARENALFADSVSSCWKMGNSKEPGNAALMDALLREIRSRKKSG